MWLLAPPAYMAALFLLSSMPGGEANAADTGLGKALAWAPPAVQNGLHLPAFGGLAWTWFRALSPWLGRTALLRVGVALTVVYAGLDEWHQAFVPGRFSSATDLVTDGIGALMAAGLFARLRGSSSP